MRDQDPCCESTPREGPGVLTSHWLSGFWAKEPFFPPAQVVDPGHVWSQVQVCLLWDLQAALSDPQ